VNWILVVVCVLFTCGGSFAQAGGAALKVCGADRMQHLIGQPLQDVRESLREQSHPDFAWTQVETTLPLYFLKAGDFRDTATAVSCGQDIAGESAFSLGQIARFREEVDKTPYRYRQLFWETGMVGQVLYLEAEALGVRATGMGCFFDDPVHDLFGLRDDSFQSLYHFTVVVLLRMRGLRRSRHTITSALMRRFPGERLRRSLWTDERNRFTLLAFRLDRCLGRQGRAGTATDALADGAQPSGHGEDR